jgi:molybdopterin-guanine dinucleotide biosynthesis protein A
MGSSKAALPWHGSTLLRRVTGLVARAVDGPVLVVRAPGQVLPELDRTVEVVADAREGRGPMQGLAAGLRALSGRAEVAYVSATDVPLLHPAFVRRVLAALGDNVDVVLPRIDGHRQTLAAAYRVDLADVAEELVAAERLKPAYLFERCRVVNLEEADVLADPAVARGDPRLDSVRGLNEPDEYARARALPAPEVEVVRVSALAPGPADVGVTLAAWSVGEAASALGLALDGGTVAAVNGGPLTQDPHVPLAAGDVVRFAARGEPRASWR